MKNLKKVLAVILSLICAFSCLSVAHALDYLEESESSNNTLEGANDLTLIGIKGNLDSNEDIDYFRLHTSKAGLLAITFEHEAKDSNASYFEIEVLNNEGLRMVYGVSKGDQSATNLPDCFVAANGDDEYYYVKVSRGTVFDQTVSYTIKYTIEEVKSNEKEPNDTIEDATEIQTGKMGDLARNIPFYSGNLMNENDVDWFSFDLAEDCYFYVVIRQSDDPNMKCNYKIQVSGYADDDPTQFSNVMPIGTFEAPSDEKTTYSPSVGASAGTYYVTISRGQEYTINSYQLGIYIKPSNTAAYPIETEPNNRHICADYIKLDGGIIGSNFDVDDQDWYTVTISNDKVYGFEFSCLDEVKYEHKWDVRIYKATQFSPENLTDNPNPVPVAELTPTTTNANNKFEFINSDGKTLYNAGKYYIVVKSTKYLDTPADYQIKMTSREKPANSESFWTRLGNIFKGFMDSPFYATFVSLLNNMDLMSMAVVIIAQLARFIPLIDWGTIIGWLNI